MTLALTIDCKIDHTLDVTRERGLNILVVCENCWSGYYKLKLIS